MSCLVVSSSDCANSSSKRFESPSTRCAMAGKELLLFSERAHARLRAAYRAVKGAQALVDCLDLLLVDGESPNLRVHRLE